MSQISGLMLTLVYDKDASYSHSWFFCFVFFLDKIVKGGEFVAEVTVGDAKCDRLFLGVLVACCVN